MARLLATNLLGWQLQALGVFSYPFPTNYKSLNRKLRTGCGAAFKSFAGTRAALASKKYHNARNPAEFPPRSGV
jgi:hypothetical protein